MIHLKYIVCQHFSLSNLCLQNTVNHIVYLHIKLNVIDLKNKVNEPIFSNNAFKSIRKHTKQRIHSGIAGILDYYETRLLLRQNLNYVIVFLYSVKKILYL